MPLFRYLWIDYGLILPVTLVGLTMTELALEGLTDPEVLKRYDAVRIGCALYRARRKDEIAIHGGVLVVKRFAHYEANPVGLTS
jgi:hypothetical protein